MTQFTVFVISLPILVKPPLVAQLQRVSKSAGALEHQPSLVAAIVSYLIESPENPPLSSLFCAVTQIITINKYVSGTMTM
jgi:hypothetical protein